MAIIRNERSARPQEAAVEDVEPEEEIDYTWHPNEDEYVSPLTVEQWAELLSDEAFMESDAGRAVRCLREYGEPATFQQLSIRYRGTMGRYRRWLAEAAQTAGMRFGVAAPQKDQFGMDEWWPLLYQIRNAGKPGAGIFEMTLRNEVEGAFLQLEEEERLAKRAENARQLKRIEQLERARKEERQRAGIRRAETLSQAKPQEETRVKPSEAQAESRGGVQDSSPSGTDDSQKVIQRPARNEQGAVSIPMSKIRAVDSVVDAVAQAPEDSGPEQLPAMNAFLQRMEQSPRKGTRFVTKEAVAQETQRDVAVPIDYARRYAERLRYAFSLMHAQVPSLTLAGIARELGDESVERLQKIVNGQMLPAFAYLDILRKRMYVNVDRLEVPDGFEEELPAFVTLEEVCGARGVGSLLIEDVPCEVAYVVDDSDDRRTGVVIRFSDVRCALLTRVAVRGAVPRATSPELESFIRMVDELDGFARAHDALRTSRQVTAADWDALVAGRVWPGRLLQ